MSAAETGGKAGLGWAVLAVALAVPGFLFYNWSSRLKAEHDKTLSAKARGRVPDGGLFQTPPAAGRLVNPIVGSTATAAGAAPRAAMSAATPALPAAAKPGAVPAASGAPAVAGAPPAEAPAPAAARSAASVAESTAAAAAFILPRDPLLSPLDLVRIEEYKEEMARRERARLDALNHHPTKARAPREHPITDDIELQGIVTTPGEDPAAIVNNETLRRGQSFTLQGHSGKVRIVNISADTVVFSYQNRQFKKVVSKE